MERFFFSCVISFVFYCVGSIFFFLVWEDILKFLGKIRFFLLSNCKVFSKYVDVKGYK